MKITITAKASATASWLAELLHEHPEAALGGDELAHHRADEC